MGDGNVDLVEALQKTIGDLANGSFQWVKIVTSRAAKLYESGRSSAQITADIGALPQNLSALYDDILSSIPEEDRETSLKLFQWICLAKTPPSIEELRLALNITVKEKYVSIHDLESLPSFISTNDQMNRTLLALTGGLAELRRPAERELGSDSGIDTQDESTDSEASETSSIPDNSDFAFRTDVPDESVRLRETASGDRKSISESERDTSDSDSSDSIVSIMSSSSTHIPWRYTNVDGGNQPPRIFLIHQSVRDHMLRRGFRTLDPGLVTTEMALYRGHRRLLSSCLWFMTARDVLDTWESLVSTYSTALSNVSIRCFRGLLDSSAFRSLARKTQEAMRTRTGELDFAALQAVYQDSNNEDRCSLRDQIWRIGGPLLTSYLKSAPELNSCDLSDYSEPRMIAALDKIIICALSMLNLAQQPYYSIFTYCKKYWAKHASAVLATGIENSLDAMLARFFSRATGSIINFLVMNGNLQHSAAGLDKPTVLAGLLTNSAGKLLPDAKNAEGQTPMHSAASAGSIEVVKFLLDLGVDIDEPNDAGVTPLSYAADNGHEAVVKLLLETGKVNVNSKDSEYGRTPLLWAAIRGHQVVVKLLLETGKVDVNSKDSKFGQTPLSWAAENGHEAVVKLLLETGKVDVDSKDSEFGRTPLLWAAENKQEAVVKLLLETGKVNVNSKDSEYGPTPLS